MFFDTEHQNETVLYEQYKDNRENLTDTEAKLMDRNITDTINEVEHVKSASTDDKEITSGQDMQMTTVEKEKTDNDIPNISVAETVHETIAYEHETKTDIKLHATKDAQTSNEISTGTEVAELSTLNTERNDDKNYDITFDKEHQTEPFLPKAFTEDLEHVKYIGTQDNNLAADYNIHTFSVEEDDYNRSTLREAETVPEKLTEDTQKHDTAADANEHATKDAHISNKEAIETKVAEVANVKTTDVKHNDTTFDTDRQFATILIKEGQEESDHFKDTTVDQAVVQVTEVISGDLAHMEGGGTDVKEFNSIPVVELDIHLSTVEENKEEINVSNEHELESVVYGMDDVPNIKDKYKTDTPMQDSKQNTNEKTSLSGDFENVREDGISDKKINTIYETENDMHTPSVDEEIADNNVHTDSVAETITDSPNEVCNAFEQLKNESKTDSTERANTSNHDHANENKASELNNMKVETNNENDNDLQMTPVEKEPTDKDLHSNTQVETVTEIIENNKPELETKADANKHATNDTHISNDEAKETEVAEVANVETTNVKHNNTTFDTERKLETILIKEDQEQSDHFKDTTVEQAVEQVTEVISGDLANMKGEGTDVNELNSMPGVELYIHLFPVEGYKEEINVSNQHKSENVVYGMGDVPNIKDKYKTDKPMQDSEQNTYEKGSLSGDIENVKDDGIIDKKIDRICETDNDMQTPFVDEEIADNNFRTNSEAETITDSPNEVSNNIAFAQLTNESKTDSNERGNTNDYDHDNENKASELNNMKVETNNENEHDLHMTSEEKEPKDKDLPTNSQVETVTEMIEDNTPELETKADANEDATTDTHISNEEAKETEVDEAENRKTNDVKHNDTTLDTERKLATILIKEGQEESDHFKDTKVEQAVEQVNETISGDSANMKGEGNDVKEFTSIPVFELDIHLSSVEEYKEELNVSNKHESENVVYGMDDVPYIKDKSKTDTPMQDSEQITNEKSSFRGVVQNVKEDGINDKKIDTIFETDNDMQTPFVDEEIADNNFRTNSEAETITDSPIEVSNDIAFAQLTNESKTDSNERANTSDYDHDNKNKASELNNMKVETNNENEHDLQMTAVEKEPKDKDLPTNSQVKTVTEMIEDNTPELETKADANEDATNDTHISNEEAKETEVAGVANVETTYVKHNDTTLDTERKLATILIKEGQEESDQFKDTEVEQAGEQVTETISGDSANMKGEGNDVKEVTSIPVFELDIHVSSVEEYKEERNVSNKHESENVVYGMDDVPYSKDKSKTDTPMQDSEQKTNEKASFSGVVENVKEDDINDKKIDTICETDNDMQSPSVEVDIADNNFPHQQRSRNHN
ncbi:hypothetical protein DPMN_194563 [Dreissena polymorpha]|uniref:Uncharacterized protein n=1 Tax=Dreissena polymorpha TaxID=45954 RepID=A0A9D3Y416_DREPO|nr:hypothetical protein DPMN_194563 [Dreissena polymorpha]